MKDVFNELRRRNISNIAIAHYVGCSAESIAELGRHRLTSEISQEDRLILIKMEGLLQKIKGRGQKVARSYSNAWMERLDAKLAKLLRIPLSRKML